MKLVIVETPSQAKTLTDVLGEGWRIEPCSARVRDLPDRPTGRGGRQRLPPDLHHRAGQRQSRAPLDESDPGERCGLCRYCRPVVLVKRWHGICWRSRPTPKTSKFIACR